MRDKSVRNQSPPFCATDYAALPPNRTRGLQSLLATAWAGRCVRRGRVEIAECAARRGVPPERSVVLVAEPVFLAAKQC